MSRPFFLDSKLQSPYPILNQKNLKIIDVWDENFEEELYKIMDLIENYNIIALDTEFPGVVKPKHYINENKEGEYDLVRDNVNSMDLIQIGISLANEKGEVPNNICSWQFNMKFDSNSCYCLPEAINVLKNSGINFDAMKQKGIEYSKFSESFISSGIVLNENLKWLSFHGGFDFGYMLKLLTNSPLPPSFDEFNEILRIYFPNLYDLKFQIQEFDSFRYDGLSRLAHGMKIQRFGVTHQAGSDSLLTLACFFELKEKLFKNEDAIMYRSHNVLFGLGKGFCQNYHHRKKSSTSTESSKKSSYDYSEGSFSNFSFYEDNYGINSSEEKNLKKFENSEKYKYSPSSSSSSSGGFTKNGFDTAYYSSFYQSYFLFLNYNNIYLPINKYRTI